MASKIKVDQIEGSTGSSITISDPITVSGDIDGINITAG